jgi:phosphinothricin acetyltransferase
MHRLTGEEVLNARQGNTVKGAFMSILIRRVQQSDLAALTAIYNHYVETTAITFDLEVKTLAQRQGWLDGFAASGRHQCFVAEVDGEAAGWASTGKFREKAAYDSTVETSIYLKPGLHGQGLGRRLFETLFTALASEDVHSAIGVITLPNVPSVRLHEAFGFELAGTLRESGRKFGRFWDIDLYQKVF